MPLLGIGNLYSTVVIIPMQYISRPPGFSFEGKTVELLAAGSSLKEQATQIYQSFGGFVGGMEKLSLRSLFLAAPQKLPSENSSPAALKSQWERVKFKTWIAPLFSLCIICQSRLKSAFCPPAASPGVHISITPWCAFLWNSAEKNQWFHLSFKERSAFFSFLFFFSF